METYRESAEGVKITPGRAVEELRAHGVRSWVESGEVRAVVPWSRLRGDGSVEFGEDVETVPCATAGELLDWLGY